MIHYTVSIEKGIKRNYDNFCKFIEETLADPRSWGVDFKRTSSKKNADFKIILARGRTIRRICNFTGLSCTSRDKNGVTIYINNYRWIRGAPKSRLKLNEYRTYIINHEVGHFLGLDDNHECKNRSRKTTHSNIAPVMNQATKGNGVCLPNCYPLSHEKKFVLS